MSDVVRPGHGSRRALRGYPGVNELDPRFVTNKRGCQFARETDKKDGLLTESRDTFRRMWTEYANVAREDWVARLHEFFHSVGEKCRLI